MKTKICGQCKKKKLLSKFSKRKIAKDGYRSCCKLCYKKLYYDKNKFRNSSLKFRYGITLEEYEIFFAKQNGVCAICGKVETATNQYGVKSLSVDHSHKTGNIRGLLCDKCNKGLGWFEENKNSLLKAIQYLKEESNAN